MSTRRILAAISAAMLVMAVGLTTGCDLSQIVDCGSQLDTIVVNNQQIVIEGCKNIQTDTIPQDAA